jgi:hypothetical protein
MKERKDWSLNGCIWINRNNKPAINNTTDNYLSYNDTSDLLIPIEFKKHLRKLGKLQQKLCKQPSSPQLKKIEREHHHIECVEQLEDNDMFDHKQYCES